MYNPQLETFLRVADAGSFNKAAEEAFITVPAVIKQIHLLEEKLGLTLFVRTHKGVTLTESGKSLYRDTKYIVQYCQDSPFLTHRSAVRFRSRIHSPHRKSLPFPICTANPC